MKKFLFVATLILMVLAVSGPVTAGAKIVETFVTYSADGVTMKGFLAYDGNVKGRRPGVLIVHEWWGQTEYVRERARMLAGMGYTALAVDMYGNGKVALHPQDADAFSSALMEHFDTARARFLAAMDVLKKQRTVKHGKIAAIGYCFGGGVVLNMARQGTDLKGVASFHGSLAAVKPARPGTVKARIMVFSGGDDRFVTKEQVAAFEREMKEAGADYQVFSYPGAMHSFTNPEADQYARKFNLPLGYNAGADKESWDELGRFLRRIFGSFQIVE